MAHAPMSDADRNDLVTWTAISCILSELTKKGVIEAADVAQNIQQMVIGFRLEGNAVFADRLHRCSEFLLTTAIDPNQKPPLT